MLFLSKTYSDWGTRNLFQCSTDLSTYNIPCYVEICFLKLRSGQCSSTTGVTFFSINLFKCPIREHDRNNRKRSKITKSSPYRPVFC
jgi:hypothetical protein